MKQIYSFLIFCILYHSTASHLNAQDSHNISTVQGSIWVNPHLRSSEISSEKVPLLIEKIAENNYRLCSQIGGVKLFTMMAFEKNCESEQPCGLSFNENCEAICNSDCSYVNALTGQPEKMPIAVYSSPNFPNTSCFQKINNTHWYAYKTLNFAQNVLNFNDIGIGNTQTIYARYSPVGYWGNSNADDFGVTMNTSAANLPDAICHEWGHYLNNRITKGSINSDNGSIETQAIDEGLGDIWSTLVRLYIEENEELEDFKTAIPDYRMWAVNRNFATTYKPYNACAILNDDLPNHIQTQAWIGGDAHTKGLSISHWFYLLSEGTKGETHTVTLQVPENETAVLTSSLCNNSNFTTKEKTLQFEIQGIGHWKSLQILYRALSIIGEDANLHSLTFPKFRCATEQAAEALFPNNCDLLQQLSTAWYALNVGEKYNLSVPDKLQFCEGENWTFSLQNEAMQSIELYAPNGELLANGETAMNFEIESVDKNHQGVYQVKYRLENNCKEKLNENCEWTKDVEVRVNNFPRIIAELPSQAICEKEKLSLDARNFMEADAYQWQTSTEGVVGENAVLDYEVTEHTILQLIGVNSCGSKELFVEVEMNELPEATEILMQMDECQSENITLWVDALYDTYVWNNNNEESENSLVVSEAGIFDLTVMNEQGCETTMSIEVGEEAFFQPIVDFEVGHILMSDEVWTTQNRRIIGKLLVPSGRTLEIEGIEVEFLDEASGIVVEEGAVLKVENAVLQGNKCENRTWKGILAKGNAYKTQNQLQYQAQVFLTNSTIRDAYIGVEMGEGYSSSFLATGGGILKAESTQFIDNSIGVLFHAYLNESQSRIEDNCAFVFAESFKGTHHLGDLGYVGILAINIGGIEVKNSLFENKQIGELLDKESNRGVGIVSWHAPMRIGTGDESEQNHFVKLYKGIDSYSTSTVLGYMMIEGNRFEEVKKAIHLQYNHFSSIVGNRFEKISGENSYGLYTQKAEGLTIANNVFEAADVATEDAPIWGVIAENSGYYGCTVYNNEFTKVGIEDKFFAAVQFEGDENPNTLIDCNRFEPISYYDLLLLDDSNRYFGEEGGCDEFDPLISPLKNEWHTFCDNVESNHLYYDNSEASINWTFMPGFAPNCYSNNFQPIVCEDDHNDCSLGGFGQLGGKDENDILSNLETAITPRKHSLIISQLVRYHLKTKELPTAIRTLQQDKLRFSNQVNTTVLKQTEREEKSLRVFNLSYLQKETLPKKLETAHEILRDVLPKQPHVYTNSAQNHQIRTVNTDLTLDNSHIKVKFKRVLNLIEGIDVAVIIADMNGRVLHHEQIKGKNSEYIIDKELIVNEKYVCSLWVNGNLVKSRKFLVVN